MDTFMGNLKPDTNYIYERVGSTVYRREAGSHPSTRQVVGYDYDPMGLKEEEALWQEILLMAKTNETLRSEIERVKMVYHLIKTESPPLMWHPV